MENGEYLSLIHLQETKVPIQQLQRRECPSRRFFLGGLAAVEVAAREGREPAWAGVPVPQKIQSFHRANLPPHPPSGWNIVDAFQCFGGRVRHGV